MKTFRKITLLIFCLLVLGACQPKHENLPNEPKIPERIQDKIRNDVALTFSEDIEPLFKINCAICHTGSGLFDTQNYALVISKIKAIENRVLIEQNMPPGGLPEQELDLIETWINDGALN